MVLKLALRMKGGVGVVAAYALFQAWAGQVILVTLKAPAQYSHIKILHTGLYRRIFVYTFCLINIFLSLS